MLKENVNIVRLIVWAYNLQLTIKLYLTVMTNKAEGQPLKVEGTDLRD
jgi:hypothetical protein